MQEKNVTLLNDSNIFTYCKYLKITKLSRGSHIDLNETI